MLRMACPKFLLVVLLLETGRAKSVTELPGLTGPLPSESSAGYLDAGNGGHLYYHLVRSEGNATADPLLVWYSGGPGSSSMAAIFHGNGPYRINKAGRVGVNEHRWSKFASVLYVDSPPGVGFSYSDVAVANYSDADTAEFNAVALANFFAQFEEFGRSDVYLAGESYGAMYVANLISALQSRSGIYPRVKGFILGSPVLDWHVLEITNVLRAVQFNLISKSILERFQYQCCPRNQCDYSERKNDECQEAVKDAKEEVHDSKINQYNFRAPCFRSELRLETVTKRFLQLIGEMKHGNVREELMRRMDGWPRNRIPSPCVNTTAIFGYLQKEDVRKALGVPSHVQPWVETSIDVLLNYKQQLTGIPAIKHEVGKGRRLLLYSGENDLVSDIEGCKTYFDWITGLVWYQSRLVFTEGHMSGIGRRKLHMENAILVEVFGAGHNVPYDKPRQIFDIVLQFLENEI